jgi:hypothetical protein
MDKASIIQDAIAYIQELQEQERHMLAQISDLESAACTDLVIQAEEDAEGSPPWKKMRRAASSINGAVFSLATDQRVEILEVIIARNVKTKYPSNDTGILALNKNTLGWQCHLLNLLMNICSTKPSLLTISIKLLSQGCIYRDHSDSEKPISRLTSSDQGHRMLLSLHGS